MRLRLIVSLIDEVVCALGCEVKPAGRHRSTGQSRCLRLVAADLVRFDTTDPAKALHPGYRCADADAKLLRRLMARQAALEDSTQTTRSRKSSE